MALRDHFQTRNAANDVLQKEINQAIQDVWDRWGVDGIAAIVYYHPETNNATYEIVRIEFEADGI